MKKSIILLGIVFSTFSILSAQAITPTLDNYQKILKRNQQVIDYLKLSPPEKTGEKYIVQVGKFQNIRNVEWLVQSIQRKYDYPVKVFIEKKEDAPLQTVYIGEFDTKEEALAANKNLKWINRKGIVKKF